MAGSIRNKRGFTLTELLVVVGILVLLTAIVVPNITARLTVARMHRAEIDISQIEVALEAYHADFGAYPGDVYPTEDVNNNGRLDDGEDVGVDVDGDGTPDYACDTDGTPSDPPNNRLDMGDGVINIDDLEWALKTTEHNGPYMDSIPNDPWGHRYVYYAPMRRPTYNSNDPNDQGDHNYLYIDPADDDTAADVGYGLPDRTLCTEDVNRDGILQASEDVGIADYDVHADVLDVREGFRDMRAGAGNGILDHGDDDNLNSDIETYISMDPPDVPVPLELGNQDISPDGLARNLGYYLYSIGRNGRDETATGYEDINLNSILDTDDPPRKKITTDDGVEFFDEDINADGTLDTGYEDTGNDGRPGTRDASEKDGELGTNEDFGTDNTPDTDYNINGELDIGGDDINSWNKEQPWREHSSYGG